MPRARLERVHCDEATVYAGIAAVCGVVSIFALTRGILYAFGRLLHRVTPASRAAALLERSTCVGVLIVAIALIGDASALLPWVALLAVATSGALCWSLTSCRWLGVGSFALYTMVVLHIVGPLLSEDVEGGRREWSALVQGQRVQLPPTSLTSMPRGDVYILSYFDKVRLEGGAATSPRRLSLRLPSWLAQRPWRADRGNVTTRRRTGRGSAVSETTSSHPTLHIIASGDDTRLSNYSHGGDDTAAPPPPSLPVVVGRDSVQLLGQRSAIWHSRLRCLIPDEDAAVAPSLAAVPCVRLHHSAILRDVVLLWATLPPPTTVAAAAAEEPRDDATPRSAPHEWKTLSIGADRGQTCADAQAELHRAVGAARSALLLECVDGIDVATLAPTFVGNAPLLVWLGWQFPGYAQRAQRLLLFVSSHVLAPALEAAVEALHSAGQQFAAWVSDMTPYARRAAGGVAIFAGGALCGPVATADGALPHSPAWHPGSALSSRCAAATRAYAAHPTFRAGAHARVSAVAVASAAADALDLVPGVWSVYAWAWTTEYHITLWIVATLRDVLYLVLCVAPQPILMVLLRVARVGAAGVPVAAVHLRSIWTCLSKLPLLSYAARLGAAVWRLECRVWAYECAALRAVAAVLAAQVLVVVRAAINGGAVACGGVASLLRRYSATSASMHVVVVFLQTALLLIAMRNELNEFISAERRRQSQLAPQQPRGSLARYMPLSLVAWLPLGSFAVRVNGFWMLVRAHHLACVHYLLVHAVAALVLVGLSVLPFTAKVHAVSLRFVFPWMSSQCFLAFFAHASSSARRTAVLFVGRALVATALQDTVGDLLYHVLKDLLMAAGLTGGLVLLLWAWPRRATLAKQVATAIADSLHSTPMPTPRRQQHPTAASSAITTPRPPRSAERRATAAGSDGDMEPHSGDDAAAERRGGSVAKQMDLSDAV
ncbi:hypothetical protein NESM_000629500 [Novymonas esmeraldas]|uniref:Uncharacterized protein n=1 Tax=Novymonas esmeraldas TaxID=1808958 RepID=A0AAW0ES66_9TRYP